MIDKKILKRCEEQGLLNDKGLRLLIDLLSHPQKEELQLQFLMIIQSKNTCKLLECLERIKPKGPDHMCRRYDCTKRTMDLGVIGEPLQEDVVVGAINE